MALPHFNSILKINKSEEIIQSVLKIKDNFDKTNIAFNCESEIKTAFIEDLLTSENVQFIDVRDAIEQPKIEGLEVINIPLSQLENNLHQLDSEKTKALFCQSGIRSKQAAQMLQEHKVQNCFSIVEGASKINNKIKEHLK